MFQRLENICFGQVQAVIEYGVQQTLFTRNVVVEARLRKSRSSGNIAHRGIVITFAMKHFGGNFEDAIPREIAVPDMLFLPFVAHLIEPTDRSVG